MQPFTVLNWPIKTFATPEGLCTAQLWQAKAYFIRAFTPAIEIRHLSPTLVLVQR